MLKNVTPSWSPPTPVSWNTANYLSLAITNECRWNFQELVYWLGQDKRVKKYWNMLPPPGAAPAAPTPPNIERAISLPITNRFIQNFQELFHWLDKKEYSKKYWNILPLLGQPHLHILKYLISLAIMKLSIKYRYYRNTKCICKKPTYIKDEE